jgi:hypothetical protein
MLRNLMEHAIPVNQWGLVVQQSWNEIGETSAGLFLECLLMTYVGGAMGALVIIKTMLPRTHPASAVTPAMSTAFHELFEYNCCRLLITFLFMQHMSLNTTYMVVCVSFFHVGAFVGCVFHGVMGAKINRKVSLSIGLIMTITMYVVFSLWSSNVMMKGLNFQDREFLDNHTTGSRKIRPFVDPNLVKALGNELGFSGAFTNDFNIACLLFIFTGFALSTVSTTLTMVVDVFSTETVCRNGLLVHGLWYWWAGQWMGCLTGGMYYIFFDIDGSFIALVVHKVMCLIIVLMSAETKGWNRTVEVTASPCYLKALYYAMYLWPQGDGCIQDLMVFMIHSRQHWNSARAGHHMWSQLQVNRTLAWFCWSIFWRLLHIPTIGGMFLAMLASPSPLNVSLCMEWFNIHRLVEGFEAYWLFVSIYCAFVGQYLRIEDVPFFLSVCESMRNLGSFLAISRWPSQLLCGDPMNCWRSQYLFSHAIFQNSGGDAGNINYVNWYLFVKSQKRQCCCPYRKLKPDAPEKCCPPCCIGPFVEDTGGCPCPCCCASCSA